MVKHIGVREGLGSIPSYRPKNNFQGYLLIGKLTLPKGWAPGLEGVLHMVAV